MASSMRRTPTGRTLRSALANRQPASTASSSSGYFVAARLFGGGRFGTPRFGAPFVGGPFVGAPLLGAPLFGAPLDLSGATPRDAECCFAIFFQAMSVLAPAGSIR